VYQVGSAPVAMLCPLIIQLCIWEHSRLAGRCPGSSAGRWGRGLCFGQWGVSGRDCALGPRSCGHLHCGPLLLTPTFYLRDNYKPFYTQRLTLGTPPESALGDCSRFSREAVLAPWVKRSMRQWPLAGDSFGVGQLGLGLGLNT
jgi:hypothetical protein